MVCLPVQCTQCTLCAIYTDADAQLDIQIKMTSNRLKVKYPQSFSIAPPLQRSLGFIQWTGAEG